MIFADVSQAVRSAVRVLAADRGRFYFVVFLCILGGGVELVGVGTLYPFLSLLNKPDLVKTNDALRFLFEYGQFQSVDRFLLWSGWLALIVFFLANFFLFLKNAYITRFCVHQNSRVSVNLLEAYLRKPMLFHVGSNSGTLSKDVIGQTDQFTNGVLLSVMTLLGDGVILIVLIGLILSVDMKMGLVITATLGVILSTALMLTRNKMQELGIKNDEANGARFIFCMAALQSVKEIKTAGKEAFFAGLFRGHADELARCYANAFIVQTLPQSIMQFVSAGTVIGMALYYIASGAELSMIVPTLVLYAVAGYRLMPSINRIAGALSQLRQFQPAIKNISQVLEESRVAGALANSSGGKPVMTCTTIEFREVGFTYPGSEQVIFDHLGLTIEGNSFVCLVGTSGSGKTTLVDLLLGLLPPVTGDILINGKSSHEIGEQSWRAMFGYVPQSVYLVDGTIAENIAFGVSPEDVDWDWLRRVVAMCHLDDFVGAQAEGLNAPVGERGSRLSGGQRQRLGIARALYRDPPILILDESTSSLDGISEKAIIQTLLELRKSKTVISIAHRDSLVRHCDRAILIDQGRVVADGTYDQLSGSSALFSSLMAELGMIRQ
jgi:ABC-type multidrug transport system fused ATPase/permease subunit